MRRKRTRLMALAVLVSMVSGIGPGSSAKPGDFEQVLEPSGHAALEFCTGLLGGEPVGDARCDVVVASAAASPAALSVQTRASTASALDPSGLLGSGQAVAVAVGKLRYEGRLRGSVSSVTVTVRVSGIEAAASANSPSVWGNTYLLVEAWPHMGFDQRVREIRWLATPGGASADEELTVEVELSGKLKGRVHVSVELGGISRVGTVSCDEDGSDCRADDGSGIGEARGSVKVDSVAVKVTG